MSVSQARVKMVVPVWMASTPTRVLVSPAGLVLTVRQPLRVTRTRAKTMVPASCLVTRTNAPALVFILEINVKVDAAGAHAKSNKNIHPHSSNRSLFVYKLHKNGIVLILYL